MHKNLRINSPCVYYGPKLQFPNAWPIVSQILIMQTNFADYGEIDQVIS